ncbi:hypothetical protein SRB5_24670 [Streptomyces sp. RB5]|uniref:Uncharacterized protein n=1 Tax=Streptomyces smaragdinus TaxID=2585196 RepID=A0A7K0CHW1_9ACTN|nr:hypothetical protein [Streptomyces smaragdinus]
MPDKALDIRSAESQEFFRGMPDALAASRPASATPALQQP